MRKLDTISTEEKFDIIEAEYDQEFGEYVDKNVGTKFFTIMDNFMILKWPDKYER